MFYFLCGFPTLFHLQPPSPPQGRIIAPPSTVVGMLLPSPLNYAFLWAGSGSPTPLHPSLVSNPKPGLRKVSRNLKNE